MELITDTIFLQPDTWDLTLDANRNIARATNPYALAQDAASACKTFQGEVFYDTTQGVPYFAEILGKRPPLELLKADYQRAALTVPEVIAARVFISSFEERHVSGQIQVTDSQRVVTAAGF